MEVDKAGPGGLRPSARTGALLVLLWAFGFFGLFWGAFAVLLAELSRALGLSPGPLGFALFVGAMASILAMALLGWMADRLGRRAFLLVSGGVFGAGIAGLAATDGYAILLVVLTTLYAASGLYDVGINAAAVDLEQGTGRRRMPVLHATFSGGGVVDALSAGGLLSAGLDYRYVYLLVLVPLAVVILMVATVRLPPPTEEREEMTKAGRFGLYRNLPLLLVAAIASWGCSRRGRWSTGPASTSASPSRSPRSSEPRGAPSFTPRWLWGGWAPPGW